MPAVARRAKEGTLSITALLLLPALLLVNGQNLSERYLDEPPPAIVSNIFAVVPVPSNAAALLDKAHEDVFAETVRNVRIVNSLLVANGMADLAVTGSYFKVELSILVEDLEDTEITVRPNLKANLRFPGLDRRWRLFLDSVFPGDAPGSRPDDKESETYTGVRRILSDWRKVDVNLSAGARWQWPPDPFASMKIGRVVEFDPFRVAPVQKFYWLESEGFGSTSSLRVDYWLMKRLIARSRSSIGISEEIDGWNWLQRLSLAYILEGTPNEPSHAIGIGADASGHHDGDWDEDMYRASVLYRFPMYSDWLFVRLAGGVEWRPQDDWEDVPYVRCGIDARFGRH